jgi:hypothetical protein
MEKKHLKPLVAVLKTFGLPFHISNYLLSGKPIDYIFAIKIQNRYLSDFTCQILIYLWLQKLIEQKIEQEDYAENIERMLSQRLPRHLSMQYAEYMTFHHQKVKKLTSIQELDKHVKRFDRRLLV